MDVTSLFCQQHAAVSLKSDIKYCSILLLFKTLPQDDSFHGASVLMFVQHVKTYFF